MHCRYKSNMLLKIASTCITAERHRRSWIRYAFKVIAKTATNKPIPVILVKNRTKKAGSIAAFAFRRFRNGAFTRGERARRKWYRDAFKIGKQPSGPATSK